MARNIKLELQKELDELLDKKNKLENFIGSIPYHNLPPIQRSLLVIQKDAMETYATCLYERKESL